MVDHCYNMYYVRVVLKHRSLYTTLALIAILLLAILCISWWSAAALPINVRVTVLCIAAGFVAARACGIPAICCERFQNSCISPAD